MSDIVDTTADEIGTELATVDEQPTTLFRTNDPVQVLEQATRVAEALKGMLASRGLTVSIQGRDHVRVEGWTTLGSMLGVVPVVVWTKKVDRGWEARVEARTLDGRVVGAAEAECLRDERQWSERDDYALRSMAQTRATSKALRGPLGFVVTLAGYDATPAEEIPRDGSQPMRGGGNGGGQASEKQLGYIASLAGKKRPAADAWADHLGVALTGPMSKQQASALIEGIKSGTVPTGQSDVPGDPGEFETPPVQDDTDVPF